MSARRSCAQNASAGPLRRVIEYTDSRLRGGGAVSPTLAPQPASCEPRNAMIYSEVGCPCACGWPGCSVAHPLLSGEESAAGGTLCACARPDYSAKGLYGQA